MPEHRIHLRKAWEAHLPGAENSPPARVELPLETGLAGNPLRLVRRFQRPAIDPDSRARLALLLEHAPGLTAVHLNGQTLWTGLADARTRLLLDWPPDAERRCVLTLEAHLDPEPPNSWGHVAIVIQNAPE